MDIANMTRPDVVDALRGVAWQEHGPTLRHSKAALETLDYLNVTIVFQRYIFPVIGEEIRQRMPMILTLGVRLTVVRFQVV